MQKKQNKIILPTNPKPRATCRRAARDLTHFRPGLIVEPLFIRFTHIYEMNAISRVAHAACHAHACRRHIVFENRSLLADLVFLDDGRSACSRRCSGSFCSPGLA